ncbi:hypothetical protein DVH05_008191 [Phytophthora capsici]|nr:hypothetical protein DVH05_008191 [Phytophthora capsici]
MVDVLELGGNYGDFNELLRRLGIAYREMDAVLDANGLNGMTVNPCDVHIREAAQGRATADAAWNHFKGVEKHLGNSQSSLEGVVFEGVVCGGRYTNQLPKAA